MTLAELLALDIGQLSPLENARYVIALETAARDAESVSRASEESRRAWRCMMLARDLETFEALLRRERVPVSRIDPEAARRLGRR